MEANTAELLKECNKGCKMAIESMNQVLEKVKDNELKNTITHYNTRHREIEDKSSKLLEKYGEQESKPGVMASTFSWVSTEVKLTLDDNDKKIAKIMMDGCNMGIQSVSEYINKYTKASGDSISLAKKLIKTEEDFMEDMKKFL